MTGLQFHFSVSHEEESFFSISFVSHMSEKTDNEKLHLRYGYRCGTGVVVQYIFLQVNFKKMQKINQNEKYLVLIG